LIKVILLDLDDTLVIDEAAVEVALRIACEHAHLRYYIDAEEFYAAVRSRMRELWYSSPAIDYCRALGIASWEGLRSNFEGDGPELAALREWTTTYKKDTWRLALADMRIRDIASADVLNTMYLKERRRPPPFFPETEAVLGGIKGKYKLALLTNGPADVQREKLKLSDLGRYFDSIVISGEVGIGKPDPGIFGIALDVLSATPDETVMVGNSLRSDVAGAQAAGIRAVWVNRAGTDAGSVIKPDYEIGDLTELERVIDTIYEKAPKRGK
jgi:putative hydrolase of the HAD superfamily